MMVEFYPIDLRAEILKDFEMASREEAIKIVDATLGIIKLDSYEKAIANVVRYRLYVRVATHASILGVFQVEGTDLHQEELGPWHYVMGTHYSIKEYAQLMRDETFVQKLQEMNCIGVVVVGKRTYRLHPGDTFGSP